ncbi:hypothetical protein PLICRDRAFT_33564, partial [Plicaturopsis crispa FD-325 SS-3]
MLDGPREKQEGSRRTGTRRSWDGACGSWDAWKLGQWLMRARPGTYGGPSALLIISAHNSGAQFKCARKIECITRNYLLLGFPKPSSAFPYGHRHSIMTLIPVSSRSSSVMATTVFGLDSECRLRYPATATDDKQLALNVADLYDTARRIGRPLPDSRTTFPIWTFS